MRPSARPILCRSLLYTKLNNNDATKIPVTLLRITTVLVSVRIRTNKMIMIIGAIFPLKITSCSWQEEFDAKCEKIQEEINKLQAQRLHSTRVCLKEQNT